ncbi:MAG: S9 family peptidase [Acidobacteriota bacterium]
MTPNHAQTSSLALLFSALSILSAPFAAWAQEPRPMTGVDLIEVPSLSDPRLSPDGSQIAYTLAEANWDENKRISHVWKLDVGSGESHQLTFGEKGERSPRWSPDGQRLAFVAERGDDESAQIYLLPTAGGEARRLTEHPTSVGSVQWAEDGKALYFLASDDKTKEQKARDKRKDDVFAYDENYQQRHLWTVDASSGETTRMTEGDYSVSSYSLGRDGRFALHVAPTPLFDDSDESEIRLLSGGELSAPLTKNGVNERGARLSPNGETVLFGAGANLEWEGYYNGNVFLMPSAGGTVRLLAEESPHDFQRAEWSSDGKSLFVQANTGARSQIFRLDPRTEELAEITSGDHQVRGWHYRPEREQHVIVLSTPNSPGEIHLVGSDGIRLAGDPFASLLEDFRIPRQELVSWKGEDGVTVEGLLTYPLDFEQGQRYPLAVQTHGGPAASDKFGFGRWNSYPQLLAARGWLVFKPNYRGSTGYGDDFLRDMVGHYYRQSHLDVMTGVDALIERGLADPDRMIKMGWSAGGHMTNKIITHTDRFKAASSGAGAVNWISMYGQSDVRIYRTPWFGGTPWEEDAPIATYWEHSPLKDIWKVKTPTLVLVGQNDLRVPAAQSIELFRALRTNGVETHLYMAPREGHGWRELRHELFKINVELDWFERHALDREYEWEAAPGEAEEDGEDEAIAPTAGG